MKMRQHEPRRMLGRAAVTPPSGYVTKGEKEMSPYPY